MQWTSLKQNLSMVRFMEVFLMFPRNYIGRKHSCTDIMIIIAMTIFNTDAIQKQFPTLIIWLIQIKFTYSSSNYF